MSDWPLAVDLDGTLIAGDVSRSAALAHPFAALAALPLLIAGRRAGFKRALAQAGAAPAMSWRAPFLAWLKEEKARGRALHLITGADQAHAEALAAPLALFDSIEGSDGETNLIGAAKAARLVQRFSEGFAYAGDSAHDIAVFARARSIILVAPKPGIANAVRALGVPIERHF
jgi:hypothetical protein